MTGTGEADSLPEFELSTDGNREGRLHCKVVDRLKCIRVLWLFSNGGW